MEIFKKKEMKQPEYDIHTRLEMARRNLAQIKQQVQQQNDGCAYIRQGITQIAGECEILQNRNRKSWRRAGILCILLLLLGIGFNAGVFLYAKVKPAQNLEQEYNAKRTVLEQKLSEE